MGRFLSALSLVSIASANSGLPEGRVFALDGQTLVQIVIQIINVAILALILHRLLYKPVKGMLAKRTKGIEDRINEGQELQAQGQALKAEYEAKIAQADQEGQAIVDEAVKDAEEEARRIIAEAEEEAKHIRDQAARSLDNERQVMRAEMKDYILEVSAMLAEKSLAESVDLDIHKDQLEEGLKELEVSSWDS